MIKSIIKKTIIILLLTIGITFTTTLALDRGKISSRSSSIINPKDTDTSYIRKVKYESQYVYFSDLVASGELPKNDKIYVMENATDLYNWSILASENDRKEYLNKHYILGADINYSSEISDPSREHFRSIGFLGNEDVLPENPTEVDLYNHGVNNKNSFQGTFDGRGFTIRNLILERVTNDNIYSVYKNSIEYLAPFSRIGINGVLKNVGFISNVITGTMDFDTIKYVSNVIGENFGKIERIFYRDERSIVQQGISFIGKIHISGLVSKTYSQIIHAYVAATRLVHLQSQEIRSVSAVIKEVWQNMDHLVQGVYYDSQILLDINTSIYGIGIITADFRNRAYFPIYSNIWILYDQYSSLDVWMDNTYPELMGFQVSGNYLYIRNEAELIYFNKIMNNDLFGFNKTGIIFYISRDMDLLAVRRKSFKQFKLDFAANLQGGWVHYNTLYPQNNTAYFERDTDFPSSSAVILNMDVDVTATEIDNHVTYGLFSQVSGTIQNINFTNFTMEVIDISRFSATKDYVAIGYLIGEVLREAQINNINLFGKVELADNQHLTSLYMGAAIGLISGGNVSGVSYNGETTDFGVQIYDNTVKKDIHIGGIAGSYLPKKGVSASQRNFSNNINVANLVGISFSDDQMNSRIHFGGVLGYAKRDNDVISFTSISNFGNIECYKSGGNIHEMYFGGAIGLIEIVNYATTDSSYIHIITNTGTIDFLVNINQKIKLAGVINIISHSTIVASSFYIYDFKNFGEMNISYIGGSAPDFGDSSIGNIDVDVAGLLTYSGGYLYFRYGFYFFGVINADITVIRNLSGGIIFNNSYSNENALETDFLYKYDSFSNNLLSTMEYSGYEIGGKGKINAYTSNKVYHDRIKIAGLVIGKLIRASTVGGVDIDFNMTHEAPSASIAMPKSDLNLFDERYIMIAGMENGISGGTISKINVNITDFGQKYNLYVTSGIFMSDLISASPNTNMQSVISEGDISVKSSVIGNSYVAGAMIFGGRIKNVQGVNLANIYNEINMSSYATPTDYVGRKVISAGLVALIYDTRDSQSLSISRCVNYGNITAVSNINTVNALSSGILGSTNYGHDSLAKEIMYTQAYGAIINYGNIISWSTNISTVGNVSAAGGLIAEGNLNNTNGYINYGNIYTNNWGGGLVGYVKKLTSNISSVINYGAIKKIANAPTKINEVPTTVVSRDKLGAIFGYAYLSYSSPFSKIVNFNKDSNWVSKMDNTGIVDAWTVNNQKSRWATLCTNDASQYPLAGNIKVYTLDESINGIYNDTFFLKSENDSYLSFLQTQSVNAKLMQKLGFNFNQNNMKLGLYVIGKTTDFSYFPEDMGYEEYYRYFHKNRSENGSNVWMKEVTEYGNETLYEKINFGIRQTKISQNMKVINGDLRINYWDYPEGTGSWYYNGMLNNGEASLDGYSLTYYADTNYSTNYDIGETHIDTYTYIKADEKYTSYGAKLIGGVWVGTHSLISGSYQEKLNGTHVKIKVKIYSTPAHFRNQFDQVTISFLDSKTKTSYIDENGKAQSKIKPARLSNSVGPYDEFGQMRGINNEIIDSLDYTAGSARAYSEAYVHNDDESQIDSSTYKDIKLIIKRLNDFELTGLSQDSQNLDKFVNTTDYRNLTYKDILAKNAYNSISFTYKNTIADNYTSSYYVDPDEFYQGSNYQYTFFSYSLSRVDGGTSFGSAYVNLSHNSYSISKKYDNMGNISYVNSASSYATISMNFGLSSLDGGEYIYTLKIGKNKNNVNNTIKLRFTVESSDVLDIHSVSSNSSMYPLVKDSLTEHIYSVKVPYGISYDPNDYNTIIVNFENYKEIIGKKQRDQVRLNNIHINFSDPVAFFSKANVVLSSIDGKRHRYSIEIEMSSESGVKKIPIYITIDEVFDTDIDVKNAYKDDVKIISSFYDQRFSGDERPAFRYEYDFTNLYLKNYIVSFEYTGMGNPLPNIHYNLVKTSNGFRMAFNNNSFAGLYKIKLDFDKSYTFSGINNPLLDTVIDWTVEFNTPEFYKIGSNESLIKDIAFITESSFTAFGTVIDYQEEMTQLRYLEFIRGNLIQPIALIPTLGIDYKTHADEKLFYIVGQVSKTDLSHYSPTFEISKGAIMRKVLSDGTLDSDLFDNYNPTLTEFAYHKYRVFAESYIPGHVEFGNMYKDYVIAVHDVEDAATINLTVEYDGVVNPFNKVFFNIKIIRDGNEFIFNMSFNAYFDSDALGYKKIANQMTLPTGTSGMYYVTPSIPDLYEVEYYVSGSSKGKKSFGIDPYILPRRHNVKFVIREKAIINLPGWGQTN